MIIIHCYFHNNIDGMKRNSLLWADVPLRSYSLTASQLSQVSFYRLNLSALDRTTVDWPQCWVALVICPVFVVITNSSAVDWQETLQNDLWLCQWDCGILNPGHLHIIIIIIIIIIIFLTLVKTREGKN